MSAHVSATNSDLRRPVLPASITIVRSRILSTAISEAISAGVSTSASRNRLAEILDFGTDLKNPNFAKLAEAACLLCLTAETPDQVRPMIVQALEHDGPALVEVLVSRQELSMPPTITFEQAKGFGLFALKAVLSGRGDEIVDLVNVNLSR